MIMRRVLEHTSIAKKKKQSKPDRPRAVIGKLHPFPALTYTVDAGSKLPQAHCFNEQYESDSTARHPRPDGASLPHPRNP